MAWGHRNLRKTLEKKDTCWGLLKNAEGQILRWNNFKRTDVHVLVHVVWKDARNSQCTMQQPSFEYPGHGTKKWPPDQGPQRSFRSSSLILFFSSDVNMESPGVDGKPRSRKSHTCTLLSADWWFSPFFHPPLSSMLSIYVIHRVFYDLSTLSITLPSSVRKLDECLLLLFFPFTHFSRSLFASPLSLLGIDFLFLNYGRVLSLLFSSWHNQSCSHWEVVSQSSKLSDEAQLLYIL